MRLWFVLALLLFSAPAWAKTETALFAGGHFWTLQHAFDQLDAIDNTVVGYMGGNVANPSFQDVARGDTGHRLVVLVVYDPARITYDQLLLYYWHQIDPLDAKGQFCDDGPQFTAAIYYMNEAQRRAAEDSKMLLEADNGRDEAGQAVTPVLPASAFYPAEEGQQVYYEKNPLRYRFYDTRCGREKRLYEIWGRPRT